MTAANRDYNGNRVASLSGGSIATGVSGESLGFSGATGQFSQANVGNALAVTVSGATLQNGEGGGLASNYNLTGQPTGLTANIAPKAVTITGMTADGKVYDGNTLAMLSGGQISTGVGSETLGFSGQTGAFVSANAGSRAVLVSNTALANGSNGGLASNYSLTQPTVANATITPRPVNITGMTALDRPFDTTNIIVISGAPVINNVVAGQSIGLSGTPVGTTQSPDITQQPVPVAVSGWALANGTGNNAGLASNYSLTPLFLTAKINPASDQGVGSQMSPLINSLRNSNTPAPSATTGGTFSGTTIPNCLFTPDLTWICIVQPGINLP